MPNATSTTTAIVEILEPPDIWGDVASELDALVQDGVPLPEQRLENMIEFYCPPKFLLLMNDRTHAAVKVAARRVKMSCFPRGRAVFADMLPDASIATMKDEILVLIPLTTRDGNDANNRQQKVELAVRQLPGGDVEIMTVQPGSTLICFEHVGIRVRNTPCRVVFGVCKAIPT